MHPEIVLLRHGQAAFGAQHYDQLSALGARQCAAVAEHWLRLRREWPGVVRGRLARHRDSLGAIASTYALAGVALPEARIDPGLDEHPGLELMQIHAGDLSTSPFDHADAQRSAYFARFRALMQAWMRDELDVGDLPRWSQFQAAVEHALDGAIDMARSEGSVLLVTSGGVAALTATKALGLAPERFVELALQLGNAARVHLRVGRHGLQLVAFNETSGLDSAELRTFL